MLEFVNLPWGYGFPQEQYDWSIILLLNHMKIYLDEDQWAKSQWTLLDGLLLIMQTKLLLYNEDQSLQTFYNPKLWISVQRPYLLCL